VIAAHLGVVDENQIDNMSIPFFNDVLAALGKRLNYESISNLYGNSFCKNAQKYISEANPLIKSTKSAAGGFAQLFANAKITKMQTKEQKKAALTEQLGDVSWADGLI